jgi:hypothetical protein
MATPVSPSLAPLLLFARISGLLAAALVISWALVFKSSFLPQSTSQEDLIYAVCTFLSFPCLPFTKTRKNKKKKNLHFLNLNCMVFFLFLFFLQVLHPLLMVIGFILISGEGNFGIN